MHITLVKFFFFAPIFQRPCFEILQSCRIASVPPSLQSPQKQYRHFETLGRRQVGWHRHVLRGVRKYVCKGLKAACQFSEHENYLDTNLLRIRKSKTVPVVLVHALRMHCTPAAFTHHVKPFVNLAWTLCPTCSFARRCVATG